MYSGNIFIFAFILFQLLLIFSTNPVFMYYFMSCHSFHYLFFCILMMNISIFEFLGALVLGRVSTDTIAGKIAIPAAFSPVGGYYCYDNRYCGAFARGRRCADQFDASGKLDTKTYFSGCQSDAACAISGAVKYIGTEACRQDDRTGQLLFEPGNPMAFAYGMMWVLLVGTGE